MCNVENICRIAKILNVNTGKLGYNADKIVTRQNSKNQLISGFSTILASLARESSGPFNTSKTDLEIQCVISQWLDYCTLFINSLHASREKVHLTSVMLKELNTYLQSRSFLIGNFLTIADLAVFFTIKDIIFALSPQQKEYYLNISRWYNYLQNHEVIHQSDSINFSTIHLA